MAMRLAGAFFLVAAIGATILHFPEPAWGDAPVSCGIPLDAGGEWPTGSPEEAGLNSAILCSLNAMLDKSPELNVHTVVVVRGGKLVFESYRTGGDLTTYTPEMQHDVRSISKSVVSLLFGIALDRKLIAGIDEPVFAYFPDLASLRTPEKDRIHLRHLLTMTSGFIWDEEVPYSDPRNGEIMMMHSPEPYRFVLEQRLRHEPGEEWNYNGGCTQLLAGVLQKITGKPIDEFAKEVLFGPLGITQFDWKDMPANGDIEAASGLRLRPRDMAKIGELVLNNGMWNGHRIVSEAWIEESTMSQPTDDLHPVGYGYQWWVNESSVGERHIPWVAGEGNGGQRIYIVPSFDLVVVITAGLYNSSSQDQIARNIFDNYVLAAIRE